MLELDDIHTYYGESHVLKGVSLKVKKASVVTLLGRNGMGKTTTVRSIIGFSPPRSGVIRFKEKEVQCLPPYAICQMGLALVPQGRRLFPSLSVEENLIIAARGKGWTLDRVHVSLPHSQSSRETQRKPAQWWGTTDGFHCKSPADQPRISADG